MAPEIEVSDRRRRVVLDWTLAGAIIACVAGFVELRSSVSELSRTTARLETQMTVLQTETHSDAQSAATKADIQRLENRIDRLVEILGDRAHSTRGGAP